MIEYVEALASSDNRNRGRVLVAALEALGIAPTFQVCRWLRIKNIIVDFSPDTEAEKLLFSAHYDAIKSCPGANDNASGVAVLLGLCRELKHSHAPVRIVFFDREEAWLRTPVLRLGLLGSLYYVWKTDLRNIAA
ncbi:MAG: M28 family peptidase, partial [Chloroflexi bacterium]|nr:M28 family peptidase [Chloroflexota bacterium]